MTSERTDALFLFVRFFAISSSSVIKWISRFLLQIVRNVPVVLIIKIFA